MKTCTKCGVEKPTSEFYYRKSRKTYYLHCKVCHNPTDSTSNFSSAWWRERFSEEDLRLFSKLKNLATKARLRTKEFDPEVDWEYLFDLWSDQNGCCVYSRLPLSIEANHLHTVSLDRIDSARGYVKGNLQLVSVTVNRMKQEFSEELFLDLCEKITNNKSRTTQE